MKSIREELIIAGISEINEHGVTGFSIRRVARSCGVSCAAPYNHFKDKREFILAIIKFVNDQWYERQRKVLAECGDSLREQIVAISVNYVKFLMEEPYFRLILMLKDDEFDNIYHQVPGQALSRSQQLIGKFFARSGMDKATQARKLQLVRALIFGAIFMFDTGEIEYNEQALENIRFCIDREFDLP